MKVSASITLINMNDGKGIESITRFYLASADSSGITTTSPGWTINIQNTSYEKRFLWSYEKITYTDGSSTTSAPCIIGTYGDTGISITDVKSQYQLGTSSDTEPTGEWSYLQPFRPAGMFLWMRDEVNFSNGEKTYTNARCVTGDQGDIGPGPVDILLDNSNYVFPSSSSGIISPSEYEKFIVNISAVQDEKYLVYQTGSLGNGEYSIELEDISGITNIETDLFRIHGTRDSVMIGDTASIAVIVKYKTFQGNESFKKVKIILSKSRAGFDGSNGEDGKGIKSITQYYAVSSSNTEAPTSWTSTSIPEMTAMNKYLWSYEKIIYTDDTFLETTKGIIGVYGDKGQDGVPGVDGKPGADGVGIKSIVSYYLATSLSSGVTTSTPGWTTTIQTITESKKYLWNYERITYTDGKTTDTTPCVKGVYGDTGPAGATGKTGQYTAYQYYASTSSTEQTGGSWSDSMPSIAGGKFLWMRTQVVPAGGTINPSGWGTPVLAGSDISKLIADIKEVDGKVEQNTAAITANSKEIATKVTQKEVDASIDKIQIGGTNLIKDSKTILLQGSDNGNRNCSVIENDTVKITPLYDGNVYNTYVYTTVTREQNKIYTLSFDILTTTDIGFYWYPSENYSKKDYIKANSKWQRVYFTYTQNDVDKNTPTLFGLQGLIAGKVVYYKNLKLELGNKGSDWSPAPQDTESKITELSSEIKQTADKIALIVTQDGKVTTRAGIEVGIVDGQGYILLDAKKIIATGTITANEIDVSNLMAQNLELQNGGIFKSERYNKGDIDLGAKKGFYLDSNGYTEIQQLKAKDINVDGLEAVNANVTGKFTADAMKTIDAIPQIDYNGIQTPYVEEWKNISADYEWSTIGTPEIRYIKFLNGRFTAIGSENYFYMSTDGINWARGGQIPLNSNYPLWGYDYGNGRYVAVGTVDSAYSTDGYTWYKGGSTSGYIVNTMVFNGSKFLIYNGNKTVYSSTDGSSWSNAGSLVTNFNNVVYGNGAYVATKYQELYYSTNGVSFSKSLTASGSSFNTPIYANGKFVVFDSKGVVRYSANGNNWYTGSVPSDMVTDNYDTIAYGKSKFITATNGKFLTSSDGITWRKDETYNITGSSLMYCAFGNDRFIIGNTRTSITYDGYNLANVYEFLSSIKPKLNSSINPQPTLEPLIVLSSVSATVYYRNTSSTIRRMKVSSGTILVEYSSGSQETFNLNPLQIYPFRIVNLIINSVAPTVEIGNMYPILQKDGTYNVSIGNEQRSFKYGYIDYIYGKEVWGAVWN